MLDPIQTRERFLKWVKSRTFTPQCKARFKTPVWPFIVAVITFPITFLLEGHRLFAPFFLISIILPIWGWNLWNQTRLRRKAFRLSLDKHEPILCALVIGNKSLFHTQGASAPALLLGSFGPQDESRVDGVLSAAEVISGVYGEDPAAVPAVLRELCQLVNDDSYRPDRRRRIPAGIFETDNLWLFDTMLVSNDLPSGAIESPWIPCMASPGETGSIVQLPPSAIVIGETPPDPNIIRHKAPASPPPLVAPVSDNGEAVENHIGRHLGNPERVFHELVSTTVHIDVHIVPATPERPWISLVTSGMSDLPMHPPEGAEDFRFAELMMRLPAGWKLDDDSFKQEENYWPIRLLKFLARFVHEYETWLSYGHTIPHGNPSRPYAPGIPFEGVILSPPSIGGDEFATLHLQDGTCIHFWSLIPLYPSELDFKLANQGADVLFQRLAATGHGDLLNPHRPPVA